ncbi:MAG: RsmD family RNA methyltransferase [Thiobacillus sp.]|nr:RsmD family RNA methyltransferase [Thiobacillus sp.]
MLAKHAAPRRAHGAANRVRIIGGQYRRRLLDFPDGADLRPTPDRVRETLFNWLGQDLPGWTCLDLLRGAGRVVMVERDLKAVGALEKNRALLGADRVDILRADALSWLANNRERFDLVFVDPPFGSGLAGAVLADLVRHLKPGGYAYIEQAAEVVAPTGFIIHRSGRAGRSYFALLIKE